VVCCGCSSPLPATLEAFLFLFLVVLLVSCIVYNLSAVCCWCVCVVCIGLGG